MTVEQNKALVRRFYEALVADDQAILDEVLAPEFVAYPSGAQGPQSREAHLQGISEWNASFDTDFTIKDQIAEGDKVATHATMHAIHSRGPFQGVSPTGRKFDIGGVSIERVQDGVIVARWVYSNRLFELQQLGLIPGPTSAG